MNNEKTMIDLLLTISFSVFGMLLIFGLGFVFPTINPYVVIKWIIIVSGAVFAYAVLAYLIGMLTLVKKDKKAKK